MTGWDKGIKENRIYGLAHRISNVRMVGNASGVLLYDKGQLITIDGSAVNGFPESEDLSHSTSDL